MAEWDITRQEYVNDCSFCNKLQENTGKHYELYGDSHERLR